MSLVTCEKCGGTGSLPHFMHIDNGVCWLCGGTGKAKPSKDTPSDCAHKIVNLIRVKNDTLEMYSFYIWEADTESNWADTGHWTVLVYCMHEAKELINTQSKSHMPLAELRKCYPPAKAGYRVMNEADYALLDEVRCNLEARDWAEAEARFEKATS